jgi:hypothetical protein
LETGGAAAPPFTASIPSRDHLEGKTMSTGLFDDLPEGSEEPANQAVVHDATGRAAASVRAGIPPIVQRNLTIESDQSEEAKDLARRSPDTRAAPIILIIVGQADDGLDHIVIDEDFTDQLFLATAEQHAEFDF